MKNLLEICCYSFESAKLAQEAGAHRIELCDNYLEGGTTPSHATIKHAVDQLQIPVNVIIRPRGGDFLYSQHEFEVMKQDVINAQKLGVNGVVFGMLKPDGEIDVERTKELMALAPSLDFTFHRAFDMCRNHLQALEKLKQCGVNRVLTSGGMNTAYEGIDLLADLVTAANKQIVVMPGSGINASNIATIRQQTGASEFHASAKTFVSSAMQYFNPAISMGKDGNVDEYQRISVEVEQITKMINILR
ncbi:copper homeostasis protein CutC [Carboxylicivirga sp. M1479]|uniref:copper homeostasis protein CutC n=1 Tax=Carboxylicivirga sp. M1479 TaxID=2594476 RepID=UPI0011780293|nr:copper homeostasis protein CutC [Carboxylicivirga sp. M1479]TRX66244.1 copper homeostasis protein CutC [Carboxylicivirga sp. M1479]